MLKKISTDNKCQKNQIQQEFHVNFFALIVLKNQDIVNICIKFVIQDVNQHVKVNRDVKVDRDVNQHVNRDVNQNVKVNR